METRSKPKALCQLRKMRCSAFRRPTQPAHCRKSRYLNGATVWFVNGSLFTVGTYASAFAVKSVIFPANYQIGRASCARPFCFYAPKKPLWRSDLTAFSTEVYLQLVQQ